MFDCRNFVFAIATAASVLVLAACSTPVKRAPAPPAPDQLQQQRLGQANADLAALKETDILLRISNELLADEILASLNPIRSLSNGWVIDDPRLNFQDQTITLSLLALPAEGAPLDDGFRLHGDIGIAYQNGYLLWQPRFQTLQMLGDPQTLYSSLAAQADEPSGADDQSSGSMETNDVDVADPMLLSNLFADITQSLVTELQTGERNRSAINLMPLGILETGARLADTPGVITNESLMLSGEFITAGSAVLVEEAVTSIAMNLNFIPGVENCPGDVSITRASFSEQIRNREPSGLSSASARDEQIQYFFTEVSGARNPTTVIHYWFADGEPASVSELNVEPSARWRTWSSRPDDRDRANYWEVVVVEKTTGCVLQTMAVVTAPEESDLAVTPEQPVVLSFAAYKDAFNDRMDGFPTMQSQPEPVALDVRRGFMTNVLSDALYDVRITSSLTYKETTATPRNATIDAFPASDIQCTARQCASTSECTINYSNCPLSRDTRDCMSCMFRNPLNNRCMSEAEDPICVAARDSANARLEIQRDNCIALETRERDACETLRTNDLVSCQRQSASARGACEAGKDQLTMAAANAQPLASINGRSQAGGRLNFEFSGFRIEGDLQRLRMELGLGADLKIDGRLDVSPIDPDGSMNQCLSTWQGEFSATTPDPNLRSGVVSYLNVEDSVLSAEWSGFSQRFAMRPAPFQSLFLNNPQALQNCRMGLDSARVLSAVSGQDSQFLRGQMELVVLPLPTRISLLPAWLTINDDTLSGKPEISEGFVSYRLVEEK